MINITQMIAKMKLLVISLWGRERETDRQTDRQTEREGARERERERKREREKERGREREFVKLPVLVP